MLSMIWNLPKPMALMAWVTVNVSSGTTPLLTKQIQLSFGTVKKENIFVFFLYDDIYCFQNWRVSQPLCLSPSTVKK